MNNFSKCAVFLLLPIFIFSCSQKEKNKGIPTEIANAYGFKEFSKVKSVEFTFNFQKDSIHAERHWKWMPASNNVVYYEKGDSTSFTIMDTSTALLKKLNGEFTNDQYWLLFPMHLQWDEGYTLTDNETATGPVTDKQYHKYTVQYDNKNGFTPGDMYELYTDDKHIVQEWAFHKTGAKDPTLMMSWQDYEDFNGIKIAKSHKTKDGKTMMNFTGISIL